MHGIDWDKSPQIRYPNVWMHQGKFGHIWLTNLTIFQPLNLPVKLWHICMGGCQMVQMAELGQIWVNMILHFFLMCAHSRLR
jgi:hypothetical protein